MYCRTRASSSPTVLTPEPGAQKLRPLIRRSCSNSRGIRTALFPFRKPRTNATLVLRGDTQAQMDVVGHRMPFQHRDATWTTQIPQDGPDLPPQPSVEDLPAVFRYDHDVVLPVPTHMGQALPLVQRLLLPAPRGLPGRKSLCLSPATARRIARSSTGLTARGRGISYYKSTTRHRARNKAKIEMPKLLTGLHSQICEHKSFPGNNLQRLLKKPRHSSRLCRAVVIKWNSSLFYRALGWKRASNYLISSTNNPMLKCGKKSFTKQSTFRRSRALFSR